MSDDALAAYLNTLGELPNVLTEEERDAAQRSGRSPAGRLRNFGAMNDGKLALVLNQVELEGNDPEALAALRAEIERR